MACCQHIISEKSRHSFLPSSLLPQREVAASLTGGGGCFRVSWGVERVGCEPASVVLGFWILTFCAFFIPPGSFKNLKKGAEQGGKGGRGGKKKSPTKHPFFSYSPFISKGVSYYGRLPFLGCYLLFAFVKMSSFLRRVRNLRVSLRDSEGMWGTCLWPGVARRGTTHEGA